MVSAALADPTRRQIMELLLDAGMPLSAREVAETFGLHVNAARMHLEKLVKGGLLAVTRRRGERGGRPAHMYVVSDEDWELHLPPRSYRPLAAILATGLRQCGRDVRAALVEEVANFVRLGFGDRRLDLQVDVGDSVTLPRVTANRNRLIRALSNVVLNAVQATPDGGAVRIGVGAREQQVVVRVHNTGSFIPPEVMKRLFVPFFTTKPNGTGLGLAIARQIVTGLGGRIDVESDPERGTTFTIELAAAPDTGESGRAAERQDLPLTTTA
jgi:DNA-binding transcriptional ArsR family regulator